MTDKPCLSVCQLSFFHRHSEKRGFHMSHVELYKTEPDPQSGFTAQSVRAMQEEEEGAMEGGRTDGWGECWQLLKEETLRLPGTRLVLQLQTQTHTLPDFTQINASNSACTGSFTSSRRSECWWSCRPSPVFTLSQSSFLSKVTSLSLKRKAKYVRDQLL